MANLIQSNNANIKIFGAKLSAGTVGSNPPSIDLASGLQAFYKLTDPSDSSGNNRTLTNNSGVSFASGKIGDAAIMYDTSKVLFTDAFQIGNTFSVSCWAKQLEPTQTALFGQYPGAWLAVFGDGSVQLSDLASYDVASSPGLVTLNQWHHFVLVVTNGVGKVYLDSSMVLEDNAHEMTLSSNAGRGFGIGGEQFSILGTKEIDAVGIWNRALNEGEVSALYNSGNGLELN